MAWDSKLTGEQKSEAERLIQNMTSEITDLQQILEADGEALDLDVQIAVIKTQVRNLQDFMEDITNA